MSDLTELTKVRNRLAKRLNSRMLRLERAAIDYGAITEYKNFVEKHYSGKRISERKQGTNISLKGEIYKIQTLLDMPTSTLAGIKRINKKRLDTFSNRYGINFKSDKELVDFINSQYYQELSKLYGSKQSMRLISESKYDKQEIQNRLNNYRTKTGRDSINSSNLLRILGFKNKASALKAIAKNLARD